MLTQVELEQQRLRLAAVSDKEWPVVINAMTNRLLKRLGGFLVGGEHGEVMIKGGRTKFGAHSEAVLGENALFFYETEFYRLLYEGDWTWPEGRPLSEQFEMMVDSVTRHGSEKEDRRKKKEERKLAEERGQEEGAPPGMESCIIEFVKPKEETMYVDLDDPNLRLKGSSGTMEDDYTGETLDENGIPRIGGEDDDGFYDCGLPNDGFDYRHWLWELLCSAADGDQELEDYVQAVGESETLKEVRTTLGLKDGDTDKLKKRLKRRVNVK